MPARISCPRCGTESIQGISERCRRCGRAFPDDLPPRRNASPASGGDVAIWILAGVAALSLLLVAATVVLLVKMPAQQGPTGGPFTAPPPGPLQGAAPGVTRPAGELLRNGDFEDGNVGFVSDYQHSPGRILDVRTYDIVRNPRDAHRDAALFGDHTNGTGLMMAVNGGNLIDRIVWTQTVVVSPGVRYSFSLWLACWFAPNPAHLDVRINGKSVGKVVAPEVCGEWKEFKATWDAGVDRTAAIEIYSLTRDLPGNAFCLDDLSFRAAR